MLLSSTLLLLLAAPPDVYFEQTTVVLKDGRPAGPGVVSRVWHAGRRMRMEAGGRDDGTALVLRLDEGRAWRIEPARRVAVALDLEKLRASAQIDMSMAAELMGTGEETRVRAARLRNTRRVSGHACAPWRLSGGAMVMEVCMAADVPVGVEAFTDLLEWTGAEQAMPGMIAALRELRGFPVETRSRVTVLGEPHETLATVTLVKTGPIDPALFGPPAGYRTETEPAAAPER